MRSFWEASGINLKPKCYQNRTLRNAPKNTLKIHPKWLQNWAPREGGRTGNARYFPSFCRSWLFLSPKWPQECHQSPKWPQNWPQTIKNEPKTIKIKLRWTQNHENRAVLDLENRSWISAASRPSGTRPDDWCTHVRTKSIKKILKWCLPPCLSLCCKRPFRNTP